MLSYQKLFQQKAALFQQLGYTTPEALLLHLPLRYEDHTRVQDVANTPHGVTAVCEVSILSSQLSFVRGKHRLLCETIDKAGTPLRLRFLNSYPAQQQRLHPGKKIRAIGVIRYFQGMAEMIHPECISPDKSHTQEKYLTPIYSTTAGLTQQRIRHIIEQILSVLTIPDHLPPSLYTQAQWRSLQETIHTLHRPPSIYASEINALNTRTHPLWRRIQWEELLALRLCFQKEEPRVTPPVSKHQKAIRAFIQNLPFELTKPQKQCWEEIATDLSSGYAMRRLLQGDVGSGKTVVAALASLLIMLEKRQVAYMAPTELLSKQVYNQFLAWFEPLGFRIGLLISDLKAQEKKKRRAAIAQGEYDCIIGTHSLIQEDTHFKDLSLLIIDEQHRFGVRQRLSLYKKARSETHQLMMSATPIPRSLSMTYYAELAISSMRGKPAHRHPVHTSILSSEKKGELIARIQEVCSARNQIYWVCPLIQESEELDLTAAEDTFFTLQKALPSLRIIFIHGRLKPEIKDQLMQSFLNGEADLMVSTTVIEVGIHVEQANIMIIEHAERFGLTQLHQLRGRVGRGSAPGKCVLLFHPPLSAKAKERLNIIKNHDDGFIIAEKDLQLRGAGNLLGEKQSGLQATLRFASLQENEDLLDEIDKVVEKIKTDFPNSIRAIKEFWFPLQEECRKT